MFLCLPSFHSSDAQITSICRWTEQATTIPMPQIGRNFNICDDLGISRSFCCGWNGWVTATGWETCPEWNPPDIPYARTKPAKCSDPEVLDAYKKAFRNPKSFINRSNLGKDIADVFETFSNEPSPIEPPGVSITGNFLPEYSKFGLPPLFNPFGQGTGGLMLPYLEEETLKKFIDRPQNQLHPLYDAFDINHFQHGAPASLHHSTNGYPHRNAAIMLAAVTRSPGFVDILLTDKQYDNKVGNLQVTSNYCVIIYFYIVM